MAINLNPGADPSLVTAATRAGLAKQLPDYSRTFENIAASYAATMQATTNMWSNIAKVGAAIGKSINKFSEGPQKSQDAEDLLTLPAAQSLKNALEESQTAIAKTFNPLNFGPENKKNRREAVKKRNDLSSTIEHISKHGASIINAFDRRGLNPGGLVNQEMTEPYDLELSAAYQATVAGETSDLGNYFVLEQDEKTEEWRYVMHHDPSKVKMADDVKATIGFPFSPISLVEGVEGKGEPIMVGDKPLSFSPEEIGKGLILYDVDKNGMRVKGPSRMKKGLEGMFDAVYAGADGQPIVEHQANEISTMIDEFAENPEAWKTRHKFGSDGGKSFKEEWTTISVTSAKGFGKLGDIVGTINALDGEQKADILEGVTDIGNDGFTDEDFFGTTQQHQDNFAALTLNMFNPGDINYDAANTGKIFKKSTLERIDAIRASSWNTNPKNPANNPNAILTKTLGNIVTSWQSGNVSDLALPYGHKIYFDEDGKFGKNSYILETGDEMLPFDASKSSSLKKILMRYAGNSKSLQNAIENMDFTKIKFGGTENNKPKSKPKTPPPITKVSNTKPSISGVPYPDRTITASGFTGKGTAEIKKLENLYGKYNVAFSYQNGKLLMTGPDGETQAVVMNRFGDKNNMISQDLIQQFILNYAK